MGHPRSDDRTAIGPSRQEQNEQENPTASARAKRASADRGQRDPGDECGLGGDQNAGEAIGAMHHQRAMDSQWSRQQHEDEQRAAEPVCPCWHLLQPAPLDVGGQTAQGLEDRRVVFVVRPQPHAIGLRHRQGELEYVDGVQAEPILE